MVKKYLLYIYYVVRVYMAMNMEELVLRCTQACKCVCCVYVCVCDVIYIICLIIIVAWIYRLLNFFLVLCMVSVVKNFHSDKDYSFL